MLFIPYWGIDNEMRTRFLFLILLFPFLSFSQQDYAFQVYFTDKGNQQVSEYHPTELMTQRAWERRQRQGIPIDELDLPPHPSYIAQVRLYELQTGHALRWSNSICIHTSDPTVAGELELLEFVDRVELLSSPTDKRLAPKFDSEDLSLKKQPSFPQTIDNWYGAAYQQIAQMNGELLHDRGFRGEGMVVAVMDGGFTNFQTITAFDSMRAEGRFLGGYDFVRDSLLDFSRMDHGSNVLSVMAGYHPNWYVGSAPKASYYLFRTETGASESRLEEVYWAAAAERADSLGVDVFNTSLGYSTFDNAAENYTYADMDGNTTLIANAADAAASRGILLVNSAGNSGAEAWTYITSPADADSVLAVGAIDSIARIVAFSSFGPSSDGDVKPNVSATGHFTWLIYSDGSVGQASGTSFSSPLVAGLATCLWQAFPERSNMEIFRAIEQSAHLFPETDPQMGYGIPDFYRAWYMLQNAILFDELPERIVVLYPNPVADRLNLAVQAGAGGSFDVHVTDLSGRSIFRDRFWVKEGMRYEQSWDFMEMLERGTYSLELRSGSFVKRLKFIKA